MAYLLFAYLIKFFWHTLHRRKEGNKKISNSYFITQIRVRSADKILDWILSVPPLSMFSTKSRKKQGFSQLKAGRLLKNYL
jgi:hypothetical protein